jgi:hypothetical protein
MNPTAVFHCQKPCQEHPHLLIDVIFEYYRCQSKQILKFEGKRLSRRPEGVLDPPVKPEDDEDTGLQSNIFDEVLSTFYR